MQILLLPRIFEELLPKKENGVQFLLTSAARALSDMYPLYWTSSKGGISMRYSYEFKRKCVELYRSGQWPETPEGCKQARFRDTVRNWVRLEDANGPEVLKHKRKNKVWTPEERLELVIQVMSGKSICSVAVENGIAHGMLQQWVRKYKNSGYNGLIEKKKGRPAKKPDMKKMNINNPRKLEETEHEELIRLRAENEYMKTEVAVIKKEIALREEKQAALLKAKKQQSSRRSAKKDTN